MARIRWEYSGDVNRSDYGGTDFAHIGARRWIFVELMNMDEACGRDNEGQPRYVCEVSMVDLDALSVETIASAVRSCGPSYRGPDGEWHQDTNLSDAALAEICKSYGAAAPLESDSGDNWRELVRAARRAARSYATDSGALESAMQRPVNALGSTAAEYMRGDFDSAMQRGCEAGDPTARLMAKMHGAPEHVIDDVRPVDWLPYVIGYMDGHAGRPRDTSPDIAPEYGRGYERGERVRKGEAPAPGWIK